MGLFDKEKIISYLSIEDKIKLTEIEIFPTIESTNQYLLEKNSLSGQVCIAEQQTQGRGRRGKTWLSPPTGNLYFSVAWRFQKKLNHPWGCLGLIAGLSVAQVIESLIHQPVKIKWPNDILIGEEKIAGILVESNLSADDLTVVIGIGLNILLPQEYRQIISYPVTDLESFKSSFCEHNQLVAKLIHILFANLTLFAQIGFETFHDQWLRYAKYINQPVKLLNDKTEMCGKMVGIAKDGALLLEQDGIITPVYSGEFSLRPQL